MATPHLRLPQDRRPLPRLRLRLRPNQRRYQHNRRPLRKRRRRRRRLLQNRRANPAGLCLRDRLTRVSSIRGQFQARLRNKRSSACRKSWWEQSNVRMKAEESTRLRLHRWPLPICLSKPNPWPNSRPRPQQRRRQPPRLRPRLRLQPRPPQVANLTGLCLGDRLTLEWSIRDQFPVRLTNRRSSG